MQRAERAQYEYPEEEVLTKVAGQPIKRHDMSTLGRGQWLNDEVSFSFSLFLSCRLSS